LLPKLLLATNNQGKVLEYRHLLQDLPYEIVTLAEQGISTVVAETGQNLEDNAILKARTLARESQLVTISDDSGLEVDALGGEPGPLSARYAGEAASDEERISYLLAKLKDVPWDKRSARFRCVIALATPDGEVELCFGECYGYIVFESKGEHGFGYDSVFYLPDLGKTMAELLLESKNKISHRGQAAKGVFQRLERLASGGYFK
jgi:XTP/dITP diphosphohydrolase